MRILLLFSVLLSLSTSSKAVALNFKNYHSQASIHTYLASLPTLYPELAHFYVLGSSLKKKEIAYVTLSEGSAGSLPAIYFNGTHHGDEWSSTESILGLIEYLVTHQSDPAVHTLLTSYVFYLQPLVNPDGHEAKTRADSEGVDLNRDYAYPGSKSGDSFKRKETQLTKNLIDQIKPRAAAAYHSGIEEVLWPWCYTAEPVSNEKLFYAITEKTAKSMKMDRYLQSYDDYATEGEFIDYAYMAYSTLALTFEVSEIKTPPAKDLEAVVARSVLGALTFAQAVWDADHGLLALSPLPLDLHSESFSNKSARWPFGRLE